MRLEREKAQIRGQIGEIRAVLGLIFKGYRILARNVRLSGAEIDIVALGPWRLGRSAPLVFVEVRVRATAEEAAGSINAEKRKRIARAAAAFLATRPHLSARPCRFDAILITPGNAPRHIRNAWVLEEGA